ncbi:hypothetical protein PHYSODRAFT_326468 [Phytophthora sojae]|uniref:Uncharacterized protein n=1 Tax=Phytophthora sojae (strain P6497) TaxID=1094619 RepID=G4YTY7_PHYSP|nr:hypothetical protein PHYSODRAFT_326468 [Phytophthora sojae]EGZ25458.1 hypothetical protein PHYSODRAFT_326468 [Phytophthora sojae]|eukprot:XP_009520746.1 hypothetical protein PHYSODRAFT_326468 [Phytophthora sojae]
MVSEKIRQLQQLLFASAFGFTAEFNFHDDVLEVLMAVAVLHYHDMLRLAPTSPYIKRVQHGLAQVSVTESELGSWSLTILGDLLQRKKKLGEPEEKPPAAPTSDDLVRKQTELIQQQLHLVEPSQGA